MTENNKELYFCDACGKVNLRWGHCWSCGYDDLTPKSEIQKMYETSKNALEKIEKFQVDDFMQDGRLTREIQEAERRNWE
jgi:predicted ATP-dependent serine protease